MVSEGLYLCTWCVDLECLFNKIASLNMYFNTTAKSAVDTAWTLHHA